MKYKVLREHVGDRHYKVGEERELREQDAARLVANGVLVDTSKLPPAVDHIPDDWKNLKADELKNLALALGGEGIKTKADAEAFVQLKIDERATSETELKVDARDNAFVIVIGDDVVGEPFETQEAAEAALAAMQAE